MNDESPGTYSPGFTDDAQVFSTYVLVAEGLDLHPSPGRLIVDGFDAEAGHTITQAQSQPDTGLLKMTFLVVGLHETEGIIASI